MVRKSSVWMAVFSVSALATAVSIQAETPAKVNESEKPSKEGIEFFEKKIRPVLVARCYECHSAEAKKSKGGLLLDTRDGLRNGGDSGAAVVPKHPQDSLLIEAIKHEGLEMPPKNKLPDSVIADFVKWVEMGAPDPRDGKTVSVKKKEIDFDEARKYWAYQPPQAVAAPQVKNAKWAKTDIDRFVLAALEAKGLQPVHDADKGTLIRRATFDLTGLPPTPAEVAAFLADKSPDAFAKVVDRLLASQQFGERWGRHWLDVARYGESTGKERNVVYRYAWRYRDYVIDAFNADKPYDRFILEQVAGDLLPSESDAQRNEHLTATGFLALSPRGLNERNAEQYLMDTVDEQIDVTTRAILATTVGCARCHDHKFDPILSTDYYAMAGIFRSTDTYAGVKRGSRTTVDAELLQLASLGPSEPSELQKEAAAEKKEEIAQLEKRIEALKGRLKGANKAPAKKKKKGNEAADTDEGVTKVDAAQIKNQIRRLEQDLANLSAVPAGGSSELVMAVRDARRPADCNLLVRGEVTERGPVVPRGFVTVLKSDHDPKINETTSGRLELAQWMASKDNPLTARVMVNRIWQHLFGNGIVETTDNFGELGEKPTHPELLDRLAIDFMNNGWSVKQAIRSIMLSRAYQLGSEHNEKNYQIDPSNQYLWRANRRRLDAEAIRDATLAVSGELDLKRPEGSVALQLGGGEIGRGLSLKPLERVGKVRSIYLPMIRGVMPEMLTVFDAADPSLLVAQREVTTVATQALFMMNSPFVMEQADKLAERLHAQKDLDDAARIDLAYRLALSRGATTAEQSRVADYLKQYRDALKDNAKKGTDTELAAWSSFCQTLLASAEFRYVY
jgi:hypothetical protein